MIMNQFGLHWLTDNLCQLLKIFFLVLNVKKLPLIRLCKILMQLSSSWSCFTRLPIDLNHDSIDEKGLEKD
ncbi:hypothetical protein H5410_056139 [Solanum commersonii]|uniref:Uncharacterized protein n=1 Tax=Solanum commersonii TaxID=4109 RepID=A0A9J5WKU2_SOLCO|nr:hypothetical protein H5410_056139 [Solanum commersonii]